MDGSKSLNRGLLIVFEGGDRCGKSTQCQMLQNALNDIGYTQVEIMRFPCRDSAIGKLISNYLSGKVEIDSPESVHLLFSANRWELSGMIREKLESGTILILDRYIASGIAFSMAKGLSKEWCISSDSGLPTADITFYLELPAEQAAFRKDYGNERYEKVSFQNHVSVAYHLQKQYHSSSWICVDAQQSPQIIHQQILEQVLSMLSCKQSNPLRNFPVNQ